MALTPASAWLFRLALRLLPRAFRDEYGAELLATLARREADVRPAGPAALARFRIREVRALVRAARDVRHRSAPAMTSHDWLAGLAIDVRLGLRALWTHPAHSIVAAVTLAVAAGAATAVFSVTNAIVFRPLPYRDPDRLVLIRDSSPPRFPVFSVSPGRFVEWQVRTRAFEGLAATSNGNVNLTGAGDPDRLAVAFISASFFDVLGVRPALGRGFTADEGRVGGPLAIVLSAALWQGRFGGREDIVGTTIAIDDMPVTVVGVMPTDFEFWRPVQVWMPLRLTDADRRRYGSHYLEVVGRVRPGVALADAREDLARAARELEVDVPDGNRSWTTLMDPLHAHRIRDVRSGLGILAAASGVVLLIACANVAGLLLARGADRQREIAVRAALGASRLRLVRQLLVESGVLGVAGAGLGVLVALATLRALLATAWTTLPRVTGVPVDWTALGFAALLAVGTPLVFGLPPALQLSRSTARAALVTGGRSGSTSLRSGTRSALIVGEVALAVVLVIGSTLLLRSLDRLTRVDLGFDPANTLVVSLSLPQSRYPSAAERERVRDELFTRLSALPGVESVAAAQSVPFFGDFVASLDVDRPADDPETRPSANFYAVTPGYFRTMGMRLLQGRDFDDTDRADGPRVALVSRQLAGRFFPGQDPLGRAVRISQGPRQDFATIVGVVDDVRHYDLDGSPTLQIYEPARQHAYFGFFHLVIRSTLAADRTTTAVRRALRDLDPLLPIANAARLEDLVERSTGPRRFTTALFGGMSFVALLLAVVGVYGLVVFTVGRRVQEFGIRLALGAAPVSLMRLVLGQGLRLAVMGVVLGLAGAWYATRLGESLFFEVSARDPMAFITAPAVLVAATIAACWAPARRALGVNPIQALRE